LKAAATAATTEKGLTVSSLCVLFSLALLERKEEEKKQETLNKKKM